MGSQVSSMDGYPAVYRCFVSASALPQRRVPNPSPSITHRGTPIARICRAESLSGLRVDADGVCQAHVFPQFGVITEAWGFIPAALYLVPASPQGLLDAQGEFRFHADAVGKPLMMKARRIDGRLGLHAQAHPIEDRKQGYGDDSWSAGRAGDEAQFAIAQEHSRRHGTERTVAGSNGIGVGLHQFIE